MFRVSHGRSVFIFRGDCSCVCEACWNHYIYIYICYICVCACQLDGDDYEALSERALVYSLDNKVERAVQLYEQVRLPHQTFLVNRIVSLPNIPCQPRNQPTKHPLSIGESDLSCSRAHEYEHEGQACSNQTFVPISPSSRSPSGLLRLTPSVPPSFMCRC